VLIPLRAIWYDACEQYRWELRDPFSYLKRHCKIPKRKKPSKEIYKVFRFDEWITIVDEIDPFFKNVVEFMIMTGTIGSEIAGLRKEDIFNSKVHIQNSIIRGYEKSELKNEYRKRKLPITESLRKVLERAISIHEGKYVFTMKSGQNFDIDSFRKNPWTNALKRAGIPYRKPYMIRHTFAAWALTLRMDPNKLVSLMGHGSKEMVYEVYGEYVEGLERDAGKILDYFGKDFIGL
jgi:integrase